MASNDPLDPASIANKWGQAADAGFAAVPNVLVLAQAKLGLSANDVVVVLNLLVHWWRSDRQPYPAPSTIAKRAGLGLRTVQRSLRQLADKGLVHKDTSGSRHSYDLSGLVAALAAKAPAYVRPGSRAIRDAKEVTNVF